MESLHKRTEEDAGETDEDAFRAYVEDLELRPEDLRKKILDVGSARRSSRSMRKSAVSIKIL